MFKSYTEPLNHTTPRLCVILIHTSQVCARPPQGRLLLLWRQLILKHWHPPPSPRNKDPVFLYPLQEPCSCTGIRPNVQFKAISDLKPLHWGLPALEASSLLGKCSQGSSKGPQRPQLGLQLSQGIQCSMPHLNGQSQLQRLCQLPEPHQTLLINRCRAWRSLLAQDISIWFMQREEGQTSTSFTLQSTGKSERVQPINHTVPQTLTGVHQKVLKSLKM